jgi:exodeoxyribonuclease VII large subunit
MDIFQDKRILSVSQLTRLIAGLLEENFEHVWVEGELSNLATPSSGHIYFTLKDADAQVRCVLFRTAAKALKFRLADGMRLMLRGRVSVFAQRGEYQLMVEYLEPQGIGALQLAFIQLKERLAKEGLFAESRKRPIPRLPRRVGIVTSPTGAAICDILHVLNRRFANLHVLLTAVRVQGDGAAEEIAAAIRDFNLYREVDVLIVGRGGGSQEDLQAFNEEVVARAIAGSRIPVISAVGHEIDITISDLAADLRAPTPSAAAELVIANKADLTATLDSLQLRLERSMTALMAVKRGALSNAGAALRDPAMLIGRLGQRLDYLQQRMDSAASGMVQERRSRLTDLGNRLWVRSPDLMRERGRAELAHLVDRRDRAVRFLLDRFREAAGRRVTALESLSPLATLARGYSITIRRDTGAVVSDSAQIDPGVRVNLRFARGTAHCLVEETFPDMRRLTGVAESV